MEQSQFPTADAPAARTSFMTVLAFLGLVAMAAGWFLPWIAKIDVGGISMSRADLETLEANAKKEGVSESVTAVAKRMLANEAVSGRDLAVLGEYRIDKEGASIDPKERRGWTVALAVLTYGPWVLGAIALLLLLGRLQKPSFPVLTLVLSVALLVGGFAGLLWLGASVKAKEGDATEPLVLGIGIYAIALGGAAALLGGLFAVRSSNWWKAYLLTIIVVVAAVWGSVAYVNPT